MIIRKKLRSTATLMPTFFFILIFFTIISPIALLFRLLGRDKLSLKKRSKVSYWVVKKPLPPNFFLDQY
jgi:hypothetical protein